MCEEDPEEFLTVQESQLAAIEEGIAAAERGDLMPHEEVRAWAESVGTADELPLPRAK